MFLRVGSSSAVVRRHRTVHGSTLNQVLGSIQSFPKRLKSVRIIAFSFFLYGSVPKAAYPGAQAFDRVVPDAEGFRQSMFQDFALRIECLLGRWRNCNVS